MKVTYSMIDKEIRTIGYGASTFLKPSLKRFKLINKLSAKLKGKNIKGLFNDQQWIKGKDGQRIRIRIHKPLHTNKNLPGVLYIHGGGYAITNPESEQTAIARLIKKRPCVVITPDYRLSLEAPYPSGLNDCYDTLLWMKNKSELLGIKKDQLIVYGSSAGGGLTAALCLYARDKKQANIAFQVPLYPMIDDTMSTDSMKDNNAPLWNESLSHFSWSLYLKDIDPNNIPIYAAPYRANDLSGLPPVFSFVGTLDPFYDETVNYMKRLQAAGVKTEYLTLEHCYHAFEQLAPNASKSIQANNFILDRFSYGIDHFFAPQNK